MANPNQIQIQRTNLNLKSLNQTTTKSLPNNCHHYRPFINQCPKNKSQSCKQEVLRCGGVSWSWSCMLYVATTSPHETAPTYSSIPNIHKRNQAPKSMMKNNKPWKLTLATLTSLLSPHSSYSPNSLSLAPI